ncbi:MAG: hypothetical protein JW889_06365 [Verrucomicrobia bacterium]|nr:hypothetical protein [Verrucomicrobiota bacterium]
MKSDRAHNGRKWGLLHAGLVLVASLSAIAVFQVLWRKAEREHEAQRCRHDQQLAVERELSRVRHLGNSERARALWRFWRRMQDERWDIRAGYEKRMMRDLVALGESAAITLAHSIHEAPASAAAYEAARRLELFGSTGIHILIEILETGSAAEQQVALSGLWHCVAGWSTVPEEEARAVREAVTPFLHESSVSLRSAAVKVLEYLED